MLDIDVNNIQDIENLNIMIENTFIYLSENNLATQYIDSKSFKRMMKKKLAEVKKPKGYLENDFREDELNNILVEYADEI